MTVALWWFWWVSTSITEADDWLARALDATTAPSATLRGTHARLLAAAARVASVRGDYLRAADLLANGLALAEESGDGQAAAHCMYSLGWLAIRQDDLDRAEDFAEEALLRFPNLTPPGWTMDALGCLGYTAVLRGDHARAELRFGEALAIARDHGSVLGAAWALECLGTCAREQGNPLRAAAMYAESLGLASRGGDPFVVANCIRSLGELAATVGRAEPAARLIGAAEALYERLGVVPEPVEQRRLERAVSPARARQPEPAYSFAWATGRALSLEQAVAEAQAVAAAVAVTLEPADTPPGLPATGLTTRELDVLRLLADGRSDREIAAELSLSYRTVTSYVTAILGKLGVDSRTAAATYAVRHDLA